MAKQASSSLKNMILSLLVITTISGASLSYVHKITAKGIEQSRQKKKIEAITAVLPQFSNNPLKEMYKIALFENDSLEVYPARRNDSLVGLAIASKTNSGFSGEIKIMVGFLPNGIVYKTKVIEHHETPGLGDKMEQPEFYSQFEQFNFHEKINSVTKNGGDIDAITAATISSRAYCNAVQNAYSVFQKNNQQWSSDSQSGATK